MPTPRACAPTSRPHLASQGLSGAVEIQHAGCQVKWQDEADVPSLVCNSYVKSNPPIIIMRWRHHIEIQHAGCQVM